MPRRVLLHGALASGSQLAELAPLLGIDVALPDLAGHGSSPESTYDLETFVDSALAVAGDEPADLIGYSLGGYVALAAAIAQPERVRRVVTIATKLAWTPEVARTESRRLEPDRLAERAPAFVADLERLHPGPGWRSVVTHTAAFLSGLGTAPPLELDRIRCPVLVLVGADDVLVTLEECTAAVDAIADARLVVLADTPHQYERMDIGVLAGEIAPFLA